jgi:hypothetical protein
MMGANISGGAASRAGGTRSPVMGAGSLAAAGTRSPHHHSTSPGAGAATPPPLPPPVVFPEFATRYYSRDFCCTVVLALRPIPRSLWVSASGERKATKKKEQSDAIDEASGWGNATRRCIRCFVLFALAHSHRGFCCLSGTLISRSFYPSAVCLFACLVVPLFAPLPRAILFDNFFSGLGHPIRLVRYFHACLHDFVQQAVSMNRHVSLCFLSFVFSPAPWGAFPFRDCICGHSVFIPFHFSMSIRFSFFFFCNEIPIYFIKSLSLDSSIIFFLFLFK